MVSLISAMCLAFIIIPGLYAGDKTPRVQPLNLENASILEPVIPASHDHICSMMIEEGDVKDITREIEAYAGQLNNQPPEQPMQPVLTSIIPNPVSKPQSIKKKPRKSRLCCCSARVEDEECSLDEEQRMREETVLKETERMEVEKRLSSSRAVRGTMLTLDSSYSNVPQEHSFYRGRTPLGVLFLSKHQHGLAIAKQLIACKASVDAFDGKGLAPLHHAVSRWIDDYAKAIPKYRDALLDADEALIKLLLDKRANIDIQDQANKETPLMMASDNARADRLVTFLISNDASLSVKDDMYQTALFKVVSSNVAQLLIDSGADVHVKDILGQTPQARAIAKKNKDMINFYADLTRRQQEAEHKQQPVLTESTVTQESTSPTLGAVMSSSVESDHNWE